MDIVRRCTRRKAFVLVLVGSTALSTTGCSLNPYATWTPEEVAARTSSTRPTIVDAMAYAQTVRAAYRSKIHDQAILDNTVSTGIITLATAVIALAAFRADTDAILGVGLAGAAGYTLANRFSNNTQELIYFAGMEALGCATAAIGPLNYDDAAKIAFNGRLDDLSTSIAAVQKGMATVQSLIPAAEAASNATEAISQARAMVTQAQGAAETADATFLSGTTLQRNIQTAGYDLTSAVDRISLAVDKAISESRPRLDSLIGIISELSSATDILAPGLNLAGVLDARIAKDYGESASQSKIEKLDGAGEERPEDFSARIALQSATEALSAAIFNLSSSNRRVAGEVNAVNSKRPLETLQVCGVDVSEISTDIALSTSGIQTDSKIDRDIDVIVSGGTSPYVARFDARPTPGVTVQSPIPGDRTVTVSVEKGAPSGSYPLRVSDAARHEKTISVVIAGEPAPPPEDAGAAPSLQSSLAKAKDLITGQTFTPDNAVAGSVYTVESAELDDNNEKLEVAVKIEPAPAAPPSNDDLIAGIVNITKNGDTASKILNAHGEAKDRITIVSTGSVSQSGVVRLGAIAPPSLVSQLTPNEVARLQMALCMPMEEVDGFWGPKTQAALDAVRATDGSGGTGGDLLQVEKDFFLSLDRTAIEDACKALAGTE
ncbi:hypothetical protein [Hwanghaeella sp.]|uniref:hypothetical protein n=1 Tax=Hwanghaeella sp. TaxID=2605943 RepID=UPI003CCBDF7F